jgi:hypothetical protein
MPTKTAVKAGQTFDVFISGTAYKAGVEKRFKVKPVSERKRGFGSQFKFTLTRAQLRDLAALLMDLGTPEPENHVETVVEAIHTDLKRFPSAAF